MALLSDSCVGVSYSDLIAVLCGVIAFLGILVTLTIGWQIYMAITFDKKLKKHKEEINSFVEKTIECIDHKITARSFHSIGMVEFELEKYKEALSSFRISTTFAAEVNDKKIIDDNIYFLNIYKSNNFMNSIPSDEVNMWVEALSKLNKLEATELIKYFSSIEQKNDLQPDQKV